MDWMAIILSYRIIYYFSGDHLHCKHGRIIGGYVSDDAVWQRCCRIIRNILMSGYDALTGHIGQCFVKWTTA